MTNVLLNIYEFQAPWAMEYLRNILHGDQQVTILTMSHGDEIPDLSFAVWSAKAIVKLISSQTAATAPYTI